MMFEEWWKIFEPKFYAAAKRGAMPQHFYTTTEVAKEAWDAGYDEARLLIEGQDEPCFFCGKRVDGFAGNPGLWPLIFTHPDGTGIPKFHHVGCVQKRLFNL